MIDLESDPKISDISSDFEAGLISESGFSEVSSTEVSTGSQNFHFRAMDAEGNVWFVKVYKEEQHAKREKEAYRLVSDSITETPSLEGNTRGHRWLGFRWQEPVPFEVVDEEAVASFAKTLAALHNCPVSKTSLPGTPPIVSSIEYRLGQLGENFLDLREKVEVLAAFTLDHDLDSIAREAENSAPDVLLHGDFSLRNTYKTSRGIVLLDYERARYGKPYKDFVKIWDRDLDKEQLKQFLEVYRAELGFPRHWPDARYMWAMRLREAVGMIPYATEVGDSAFLKWNYDLLDQLERESKQIFAGG